jgi:hypothetical protein
MTDSAPSPSSVDVPAAAGVQQIGQLEPVTIAGPAAVPGIAAGSVDARAVAVRQGSIGGVLASDAEISQGYVGTAAAGTLRVQQSFVRAAIANTFSAGPSTTVVFLVARRLEGNPRVLFDWRAAAVVVTAVAGLRLVARIRR